MTLKERRKQSGLTQEECAKLLGVPRRTYQNYENDESKKTTVMYGFLLEKLDELMRIDEEHGIVDIARIEEVCRRVFSTRDVEYCYLFGSYAKGTANPKSDIDLLVATPLSGMGFFELAEALREEFKKKVDVLGVEQLRDNPALTETILKEGIKIYG